MTSALEIVFLLCVMTMLHSYVFYPILLFVLPGKKRKAEPPAAAEFPVITIICAAYNEEKVIEEKIRSTFHTNYPSTKITLLIGTDNCSDNTVPIIKRLQATYPGLVLKEFTTRTGKIGILNALCQEAGSDILVMTDANVFFTPKALPELIKHFQDARVGMVCGHIIKRASNQAAITSTELQYMNFENRLKMAESRNFGLVMGAEGGCYAMRRELVRGIPAHFIADDFFMTCLVLRARKEILFEEQALVYEDVAADSKGEFRRKARIATGNFQNLFYFFDLNTQFGNATAFCFQSHKILRWITPFLFALSLACAALLFNVHAVFRFALYAQLGLIALWLLNWIFVSVGIKIRPLMAFGHFMLMNVALAVGFFRFCGGVKSSVWEPVKR